MADLAFISMALLLAAACVGAEEEESPTESADAAGHRQELETLSEEWAGASATVNYDFTDSPRSHGAVQRKV